MSFFKWKKVGKCSFSQIRYRLFEIFPRFEKSRLEQLEIAWNCTRNKLNEKNLFFNYFHAAFVLYLFAHSLLLCRRLFLHHFISFFSPDLLNLFELKSNESILYLIFTISMHQILRTVIRALVAISADKNIYVDR